MAGIYLPVASGTVTAANMKISAVAGTSFIDFTAADVLTTKLGNLLVVRDSAKRAIQGYIKAGGVAETLSDEINTDVGFANAGLWTLSSNWSIALEKAVAANADGNIILTGVTPFTLHALFKATVTVSDYTAGKASLYPQHGTEATHLWFSGNGAKTVYQTSPDGTRPLGISKRDSNLTAKFDDLSVKQVTGPSATGVTVSSTKGGTAMDNWAQKNTAFNYNDSSGYTYEIYKVLNAPVVDSDTVLNADATIVLTDGSAAWSAVGIDDSVYLTGKYIVAVYDAAGVAAFGYYQSAGAGAVVNTKGGATQNWISIGTGFSTAGNFTRKVLYVGD